MNQLHPQRKEVFPQRTKLHPQRRYVFPQRTLVHKYSTQTVVFKMYLPRLLLILIVI